MAVIGDIARFRRPQKLVNYFGLYSKSPSIRTWRCSSWTRQQVGGSHARATLVRRQGQRRRHQVPCTHFSSGQDQTRPSGCCRSGNLSQLHVRRLF
ncbi:hypothetical protein ACXHXM_01040|uniref:hypothetical protein n=1 Tax=Rhizobium altiplani TaxID=1864509 RepID=UPI003CC99BFA